MLELMARGGLRIGEVLKLTPRDVNDRKLIIRIKKVRVAAVHDCLHRAFPKIEDWEPAS